jgi:hypothetical protein
LSSSLDFFTVCAIVDPVRNGPDPLSFPNSRRKNMKPLLLILALLALAASGCASRGSVVDTFTAEALEKNGDGEPSEARNDRNGYCRTVTPTKTFSADGFKCRYFATVEEIYGQKKAYGDLACRRQDGGWEVIRPRSSYYGYPTLVSPYHWPAYGGWGQYPVFPSPYFSPFGGLYGSFYFRVQ